MTKDEALRMAWEKFEGMNHEDSIYAGEFDDEVNAIKEALAQPAQAPEIHSRWQETIAGIPVIFDSESEANRFMEHHFANAGKLMEQPEQQSVYCLHCEELRKQVKALKLCLEVERGFREQEQPAQQEPTGVLHIDRLDKWLDASLKERKAQQQEPVAWLDEEKKIIYWHNTHETDDYHGFKRTTPLYSTPPQRTWVSLTNEDAQWLYDNCRTPSNLIDMTEAKVKELNT